MINIVCLHLLILLAVDRKQYNTEDSEGFAIVELFTSEGCSSCPAADNIISKLSDKHISNVFILAYHVDYWNRLGWKDAFSDAGFSARQRNYAKVFKSASVYTPQVIVNGKTEFTGSNESRLNRELEINLKKSGSVVRITSTRMSQKLTVHADIPDADSNTLLTIALVQPEATTNVSAGENVGKVLHHTNIVRSLTTVPAKKKQDIGIDIPEPLLNTNFTIVAFFQDLHTLAIRGASEIRANAGGN